ncbi:MAG TPA: nucleoside-diphosphate sugar epimerase/dehydratase [Gemmatimonadaceae bacterium]|nr:nucleoside-diphosphate sugar epimerase/dehydratase [Gemmatimonadaceae bacterium]
MQAVHLPRLVAHRRAIIVAVHVALIPAAFLGAFCLRFDVPVPAEYMARFWAALPYLLGLRLLVFERFGLYRGYWRHVGVRDLVDLVWAVTLSSVALVAVLFITGGARGFPRSVLMLDWLLVIFLSGGVRFAARCMREGPSLIHPEQGQRVLVIGAGEAAERFLRQALRGGDGRMYIVGLVDDDPATLGRSLHGVEVLGSTNDLRWLVLRHRIERLVIAIPSATGEQVRLIVERCRETEVDFKILPSLRELLEGRAQIGQLRDVQIEDLLGREPVQLEMEDVVRDIAGKVVLITGAAGSIGLELARQVARLGPARIVLLERAESPLYFAHLELQKVSAPTEVYPAMADITSVERLEEVFAKHRPDCVFHAAAYKHVPMLEAHVFEAVWNNVIGTLLVASCAAQHGVGKFVLISTDKAVNPTSILGATKRIAERIVLELPSLRAASTDFRAVRFGNVLGSDGSVIPLFRRQIAAGGPLTVTHREVRRYFMTIPEAVQLVLEAAAIPEAAGRISMLEMGRSVRIIDLAEQLIRLSGLTPYQDIDIVFTGLRPGEKLDEELVASAEATVPTSLEKVRVIERDATDGTDIEQGLGMISRALSSGSRDELVRVLQTLVPEYKPWGRQQPLDRPVDRVPAQWGNGAAAGGGGGDAPGETPTIQVPANAELPGSAAAFRRVWDTRSA